METIYSKDGTPIAYERGGSGPPLVLVHGTCADHVRWTPVLPALQERFTTFAVDRRGRGSSGDAPDYSVEREFEDVAAVVDSLGQPVNLLGHSFGGLCALEGAARARNLRRLVLYEPAYGIGGPGLIPLEPLARMQDQLKAGDPDGVVVTLCREIIGTPPDELEAMRASPLWTGYVAAAHTVVRESDAILHRYHPDPERLQALRVPTLLLLGGESASIFGHGVQAVHELLPDSRLVVLPGQGHAAMDTAPDLFVREVVTFLSEA